MTEQVNDAAPNEDTQQQEMEETPQTEDTSTTPVIDWEKRYNDLRSFADRRDTERQQELQTYQERLEAVEASQQQPDYDDGDYGELDEFDIAVRRELDEVKAQLRQREEQDTLARQKQEEHAHIDAELDTIEKEFDEELNDKESEWIGNYALANRDEHGRPDVRLAYATYNELLEGRKSQWVSKKKSTASPAAGPGAVEVPELKTARDRIDFINEQVRNSQ
jgi:hypothetical protein